MTVRTNASRYLLPTATILLALELAGCTQSTLQQSSNFPVGSTQTDPDTGLKFVVDDNRSGAASNLHVSGVYWGRLVDVYAPNTTTGLDELLFDDFLIGASVASDGTDFTLARNPTTGVESLTILHPFGTAEFNAAFAQIESGLQLLIDKSLDVQELPPFTAVPRNAAVVVEFDDLIDVSTLTNETVRLSVGNPPTSTFSARLVPDANHGDLLNNTFYSTRAIVDMTISELEAIPLGAVVNGIGLPECDNISQANVVLRIPTRLAVGSQFEVLQNLAGHSVSFTGNGSTDPFAASLDVVRAFRSGGRTTVTSDPFNGFLDDTSAPRIVSQQSVTVGSLFQVGNDYLVDVVFSTTGCAMTPRTGDLLKMVTGVYAQVIQDGSAPSGGVASGVKVHVIYPIGAELDITNNNTGEYRTPWLRTSDQITHPECWVTVSPPPATGADTGLDKSSSFSLLFSEPMDPRRVSAFDTLQLLYGFTTPSMQSQVTGQISASSDLTRYTFLPSLPLRHAAAGTETYRVNLPTGTNGPVDLAGNGLPVAFTDGTNALPNFTLLAAQAAIESRSVMLKFTSTDEDSSAPIPGNDLRGQVIYDLANGRVRPRSVARLSGVCDPQTPMVGLMAGGTIAAPSAFWNIGGDTQLPLWRYGCRLQTVWRHPDLGFRLLDDSTHNLDVEGLSWMPLGAGLQVDNFPQFQIGLAHCLSLPDEGVLTSGPAPVPQPLTSISDVFLDNLLSATEDPLVIAHPKARGYTVQPLDVFVSASGSTMAPYPLNRGTTAAQTVLYTWRDNSKLSVGQPDRATVGTGDGSRLINERVLDTGAPAVVYPKGAVPTIALPLLMDFRCYPDSLVTSANRLMGKLAVAPASAAQIENPPFFTSWTAGYVTLLGIPTPIDPDQQIVAAGALVPGGVNNLPRNQFVFFGQGDFVTRVSRAHTRWFECAPSAPGGSFNFADTVIDPGATLLPTGTQVLLHYRGATGVTGTVGAFDVAENYDPYGNRLAGAPSFLVAFTGGISTWKSSIQQINGSQFFQARITMISNIASGATPELSSLGFAFYR